VSEFLDAVELRARAARAGWGPVRVVSATDSTNADAAAAARAGAQAGLVVASPHQRAGRGRFDRVWTTPPDTCVALSVLVRPRRPLAAWGWLSLLAGMAVVDGLRAASGVPAVLKWPNDVLIGGRKVCGILSEAVAAPGAPAAVLGMGLNIALRDEDLPVPTATSLLLEGSTAPAAEVAAAILDALAGWYARWDAGEPLGDAYRDRCDTLGRAVRVLVPGGQVEGTASGVDADGALLVSTAAGQRAFAAGDVVHLRPAERGER